MKTFNLKNLIKDLNTYREPNKDIILKNSINERLEKCLKVYYEDLNKAFDRCNEYNEEHNLRMMKKLNKD